MTNIIKQALLDKENQIISELESLTTTDRAMKIHRAYQLLDLTKDVEIKCNFGDSFYLYFDGKEILSIHNRDYGKPYLNTYTTTMDSVFEFQRLVINGRIAEKFLNDSELFSKLFEKTELDSQINELVSQRFKVRSEIDKLQRQEAEEIRAKKLADLLDGQEIVFDKPTTITVGSGRYNHVQRVISLKVVNKNKSGKKVDVDFTCLKWGQDWGGESIVILQPNIQIKYLENQI
jgi:hypothetical protein